MLLCCELKKPKHLALTDFNQNKKTIIILYNVPELTDLLVFLIKS